MKRIFKYRLPPVGYSGLAMHDPARFLAVGWQGRQLVMWAEVHDEYPPLVQHMHVVVTGGRPPSEADYIGTATLDEAGEPYVVHVYREWASSANEHSPKWLAAHV